MSDVTEAPPLSLFIYYRVHATRQVQAQGAIESVQEQLRQEYPGLQTRLMRRADNQADEPEATWMEVYECPGDMGAACQARLAALLEALPPDLTGPRHVETFCDLQ